MTSEEIKLALDQMRALKAYSLRLFLDNGTTVLVHDWNEDKLDNGLLRVMSRGRQAMIAISRILVIEMVPPPPPQ